MLDCFFGSMQGYR